MMDDIIRDLVEHGDALIQGVSLIEIANVPSRPSIVYREAFKGVVRVDENPIEIAVVLPWHFPQDKPVVFLTKPSTVGFIPHVEPDGFVCYAPDEGLLLDQDNPLGIVREAISRAISTLQRGISGVNRNDFLMEFEAYWACQSPVKRVDCLVDMEDTVKAITVLDDPDQGRPVFLYDQKRPTVVRYAQSLFHYDVFNCATCQGIYIPLRKGSRVFPPAYGSFWTVKELKHMISSNITGANKKKLERMIKRMSFSRNAKTYVVLAIPQTEENTVLVGVEFSNFKDRPELGHFAKFPHPLRAVKCGFDMTPLVLKRHHPNFLVQRTSGYADLQDKHVAIVGVGAVGSRIAMELARAGISKLTLVDDDGLNVENVLRHELGVHSLNVFNSQKHKLTPVSKVDGMYLELTAKFPLIEVQTECHNVLDMLESDVNQFEQYDLIVVAIGDPTVEMHINRGMHELQNPPIVMYTWLEPLGIGGHALVTLNGDRTGCFECLYTRPIEPDEPMKNRASFAAPNQYFGKTLSGCQSTFTPYSSLDALQTAIMATRLAVSVLTSQEQGNPIHSWKGDARSFLDNRFKLSERYEVTSEELFASRYAYKAPACPVCGNGELT